MAKDKKTKRVAGEDLEHTAFAHVGDTEDPSTWKLPIKFSTEEKTKRHIRNALARIDQTKGMSDAEREAARAKVHAAATAHGIDVTEPSAKRDKITGLVKAQIESKADETGLKGDVVKGLYAVSRLADMLENMSSLWEYSVYEREIEGDDSEVPEELRNILDGMIETFIAMATEEAKELAANKNAVNPTGEKTMTPEELQKQQDAEKAAKKSLASHFAKAANHHEKMADHHEAVADHHEALEAMHKSAHEGMKKANVNTEAEAEPKGSEVVDVAAEFHKSAAAEHGKMASRHDKMAKAHDAHAEHCDKMATACDEDEAKKVAKELKESDAALAKTDAEATPKVEADDFLTKSTKLAQENLMKNPTFIKELEDAQRAVLLSKLAASGAAALEKEAIVPSLVKGPGAPELVLRGGGKYDFAKDSAEAADSPGF